MRRYGLLMVLLAALVAVGCRPGRPVGNFAYDFPAAEMQKGFSEKQMHNAIVKACADNNWRVAELGANTIGATLTVRSKHVVEVSIPYTVSHYSINYKNSSNMEYKVNRDGTTVIHPNYNNWVGRLDQDIRKNLAAKEF